MRRRGAFLSAVFLHLAETRMVQLNIEHRARAKAEAKPKGRLVLINVEQTLNECPETDGPQYRAWAHLGGSVIAAVAEEAGYEVVFHDENLQGFAELSKLITPGCIVAGSLVVTGIDRFVHVIAPEAKRLGARLVIAGNDAAMFRAEQIFNREDTHVDAVFTSSELSPFREFLNAIQTTEIEDIYIPEVATASNMMLNRSNDFLRILSEKAERKRQRKFGKRRPDFFRVPKFSNEHLEISAQNYRRAFAKQHENIENVRPALALFAQGCTRTTDGHICRYCTIGDVGVIEMASKAYLKKLLDEYKAKGINYVFNVTDSSFGMVKLLNQLEELGAHFSEGMVLYARAHELAQPGAPELIRRWKALTGNGRLVFNIGMDSGNEQMLQNVNKASASGSRLGENWQALRNIKEAGAYAHFSVIFGIPGENIDSCEETFKFVTDGVEYLGTQVAQAEADVFWLNFGAPIARIFTSYGEAKKIAKIAGKTISKDVWMRDFYAYRNELSVPRIVLENYYKHFTHITLQDAEGLRDRVGNLMEHHETAAPPRKFSFSPPLTSRAE